MMNVRPRNGRKTTSAFASSPLSPALSPEYRGAGAVFRRFLASHLLSGQTRCLPWRCLRRIGAWLLVLAMGNAVPAATFVVAPGGSDQNPGAKERPLATLPAAVDAARKAGAGPHRIAVTPGEHFLATTLELDARDNGLTIEAEPAGRATLYGGRLVTGWRRDGDHFWAADLPGVKEGTWDFRALVVNVEVGKGFGASAYYLDEGARDCIVEQNVAQGVPMPTHNHITRNTVVRNNVFIADKDMTVSFQRSVGCSFEGNTLYVPGKLIVRQPNAITAWKDNVVFAGGLGPNDAPQPFTISDAMPAEAAPGRKTSAAEAVRIATAPTVDGEIKTGEWPGKIQTLDREPSRFSVGGAPVLAKFAYDDQYLYVSANVAMFAPAKVTTGSAWGQDDGVEICLAGQSPDGQPVTFVIRGFAGSAVQSVTDAGASAERAARLGKEVRFAARLTKGAGTSLRGWCSEWAIPFSALGLKPAPGMKIAFNMSAFCSEFGEWHCWEGTLAESWRLEQAGTLQFAKTE